MTNANQVLDRVSTNNAFADCCRIAAMAGEKAPEFVNYGRVYETADGNFRIVSEMAPKRSRKPFLTFIERVA